MTDQDASHLMRGLFVSILKDEASNRYDSSGFLFLMHTYTIFRAQVEIHRNPVQID